MRCGALTGVAVEQNLRAGRHRSLQEAGRHLKKHSAEQAAAGKLLSG